MGSTTNVAARTCSEKELLRAAANRSDGGSSPDVVSSWPNSVLPLTSSATTTSTVMLSVGSEGFSCRVGKFMMGTSLLSPACVALELVGVQGQ